MRILTALSLSVVIGAGFGAVMMRDYDATIVANILQSDDNNITRNVEQANALLDVYEQELSAAQQQTAKDHLKRDADGRELEQGYDWRQYPNGR